MKADLYLQRSTHNPDTPFALVLSHPADVNPKVLAYVTEQQATDILEAGSVCWAEQVPRRRGQTHWPGCATEGGPAHYECAVAEIRELRGYEAARVAATDKRIAELQAEIDWLREQEAVLTHDAAVQEAEITRLRAALETKK